MEYRLVTIGYTLIIASCAAGIGANENVHGASAGRESNHRIGFRGETSSVAGNSRIGFGHSRQFPISSQFGRRSNTGRNPISGQTEFRGPPLEIPRSVDGRFITPTNVALPATHGAFPGFSGIPFNQNRATGRVAIPVTPRPQFVGSAVESPSSSGHIAVGEHSGFPGIDPGRFGTSTSGVLSTSQRGLEATAGSHLTFGIPSAAVFIRDPNAQTLSSGLTQNNAPGQFHSFPNGIPINNFGSTAGFPVPTFIGSNEGFTGIPNGLPSSSLGTTAGFPVPTFIGSNEGFRGIPNGLPSSSLGTTAGFPIPTIIGSNEGFGGLPNGLSSSSLGTTAGFPGAGFRGAHGLSGGSLSGIPVESPGATLSGFPGGAAGFSNSIPENGFRGTVRPLTLTPGLSESGFGGSIRPLTLIPGSPERAFGSTIRPLTLTPGSSGRFGTSSIGRSVSNPGGFSSASRQPATRRPEALVAHPEGVFRSSQLEHESLNDDLHINSPRRFVSSERLRRVFAGPTPSISHVEIPENSRFTNHRNSPGSGRSLERLATASAISSRTPTGFERFSIGSPAELGSSLKSDSQNTFLRGNGRSFGKSIEDGELRSNFDSSFDVTVEPFRHTAQGLSFRRLNTSARSRPEGFPRRHPSSFSDSSQGAGDFSSSSLHGTNRDSTAHLGGRRGLFSEGIFRESTTTRPLSSERRFSG